VDESRDRLLERRRLSGPPGGELSAEGTRRVEKLLSAAEKKPVDPFREIDWDVPIDDSAYHLPPEMLPLFGTSLWEGMTETERRAYSRHEASAQFAYGMWFENILINAIMRHLYHLPATDPMHRFLLTEVGEETRHSAMFGEYIRRAGTPAYLPSLWLRLQGGFMKLTANRVTFYLSILGAESLLDFVNRKTVNSRGLHPVYWKIIRIHLAEEERHIAFSKEYLAGVWPELGIFARFWAKWYSPLIVFTIVQASVCAQVYSRLGLTGGYRAAWRNPHRRAWVVQALSKYVAFLEGIGAIDWSTRWLWRAFGLTA
jgi:hypothetical protein